MHSIIVLHQLSSLSVDNSLWEPNRILLDPPSNKDDEMHSPACGHEPMHQYPISFSPASPFYRSYHSTGSGLCLQRENKCSPFRSVLPPIPYKHIIVHLSQNKFRFCYDFLIVNTFRCSSIKHRVSSTDFTISHKSHDQYSGSWHP